MDVTLPKATCIKRAAKNKEEGNALITGGNIEMAAQHYVKALQYCSKVTDATEEEREQLDSLKLASNLNLAMVSYGCCRFSHGYSATLKWIQRQATGRLLGVVLRRLI